MKLHAYQTEAVRFAIDRLLTQSQKGAGLFLEPGLGKTAITIRILEYIDTLDTLGSTLIVAPKRVLQTAWPKEFAQWNSPLSFTLVTGSPSQRRRRLTEKTDCYLINPELIPWIAKDYVFDNLVIDESTKFKNWTSKRMRSLRKLLPAAKRRIILTGTPSPNSLADLFSQLFILDDGVALGTTLTSFRAKYMQPVGQYHQWMVRPGCEQTIRDKVAPLCLYMDAVSHLDMPEVLYHEIPVPLPARVADQYDQIEEELFADLDEGGVILAESASSRYTLCRQMANGRAYHPQRTNREVVDFHREKVDALVDLHDELAGKQLLVAYQFSHDLAAIKSAFPNAAVINGETSAAELKRILTAWNAGRVGVLAAQSQAMSHGVDGLQHGGNDVCWFGLTDQPEVHDQLNRRIWRQGVQGQVRIHYLLAENTVDYAVIKRLRSKSRKQLSLLEAIQEYRKEKEDVPQRRDPTSVRS